VITTLAKPIGCPDVASITFTVKLPECSRLREGATVLEPDVVTTGALKLPETNPAAAALIV
jgi:hypothetical protein